MDTAGPAADEAAKGGAQPESQADATNTKQAKRVADADQMQRFIAAAFRYAPEGTYANLRAFYNTGANRPPFKVKAYSMSGGLDGLLRQATAMATAAAQQPAGKDGVVFCPPLCVFSNNRSGGEADVAAGLLLSTDLDTTDPEAGLAQLEGLLQTPTMVVDTGGDWTDPTTGEVKPRKHVHFRLNEPVTDGAGLRKLRRARELAIALIGGDPSGAPVSHCFRWAGSWHTKGEPRQAPISGGDPDAEIDLDDALDILEQAATMRGIVLEERGQGEERPKAAPAGDDDLAALADAIPNHDASWEEWNRIGMAFFAASEGQDTGLIAWERWSRKSTKGHGGTSARWEHFRKSPPTKIGFGTLLYEARKAVPKFTTPSYNRKLDEARARRDEEAAERTANGQDFQEPAERPEWSDDGRRLIYLTEAHAIENVRDCAHILNDQIFLRGHIPTVLVQVEDAGKGKAADDDEPEPGIVIDGVRRAEGSLFLTDPTPGRVQFRLDIEILFQRHDKREGKWVDKSCPPGLAKRIIEAASDLPFRPVTGIVCTPLFRDGKIVTGAGYYKPLGCYLDLPDGIPPVPDRPTSRDVERAVRQILRPFTGYLEGKTADALTRARCAFMAAVMTAVLRASLPAAPAILIDGNVPGSGKGKAARALAVIASGRLPAIITEGHSPEETEKRIAAAVLSGSPALLIDNLQRPLASSTLESGLTEGVATIRLFGKLTDLTVACNALTLVTANNASLRSDMLRRTLPVRIVAETETPEQREFAFDPYLRAKEERLEIIAAVLTVARAWWLEKDTVRSREILKTTLGSFEAWAQLVAGATEWQTGMSPVKLIEERKAADPKKGDERLVIEKLYEWQEGRPADKSRWWTAREVAADITITSEIWAAAIEFRGEKPTPKQIGKWLGSKRDAVVAGLKLAALPTRTGTLEWQVQGLQGFAGNDSVRRGKNGSDHQNDGLGDTDKKSPSEEDKKKYAGANKPCETQQTQQAPPHTGANGHGAEANGSGRKWETKF